jgi:hypothetical protein
MLIILRSTPPPIVQYIDEVQDISEEESEYEVQALLADDVRIINGEKIRFYLVKWVGYDNDQNSWEPAANVGLGAIRDYEARKEDRLHLHGAERNHLRAV